MELWVLIENSSLPIITKKYDSEDDEDWNPDEINSNAKWIIEFWILLGNG